MTSLTEKLMNNWGAKADSFDCVALSRLYDTESAWECYIYALDPQNENTAKVIVYNGTWVFSEVNIDELMVTFYAENGRMPMHDLEFRGAYLKQILKGTDQNEWETD